jgi:hypothetical protein
MQPADKQRAYAKRQAELLKVPYIEPNPEPKLDAKAMVHMTSEAFAGVMVEFHRKTLDWDLKQFVYDNLTTSAPEFFSRFVALQKEADKKEECVFKAAMAAHVLATDPKGTEEDADDFLDILAWMGQRERLETKRRSDRIAQQTSRTKSDAVPPQTPTEWTIHEDSSGPGLKSIDLRKVETYYDHRIAELEAERDKLEQQAATPE